ncbi:FAD-dependent monooxygenase [Streptomyces sp. NPDC087440]|uniref:FAD-dependent monooxygenase n=1 Tax=Streptomyces sp. NPDC087440 TaxID=3365790 RepID=UPI00381BAEBF
MPIDRFPERTRVLIAGGGPVGMLLACELALQNVEAIVLEQDVRVRDTPRAGTLHARSVQSLLRRGFLRLPEPGRLDLHHCTGFHFAGLPLLEITTPTAEGPPIFNQSQSALEEAFEARARALGAEIRRGVRVTGLTEHPDRVEVDTLAEDGTRSRIEADWLIGSDGARSTVREAAGIPATTTPPSFSGIVALVELLDPVTAPGGWAHGPEGATLINVNPYGLSRVVVHDFTHPFPDRQQPVSFGELNEATTRVLGREVPMRGATYLSRFSDFTRLADTYRSAGPGRVLLAGDAAHVHAPLGGQGLNTGLQDAFNLGWKLGAVARGDAPAALLDTYTRERRPVGRQVVDNTRTQAAVMNPHPEHDPLRAHITAQLADPARVKELADIVSGQGIRYRETASDASPLEGTFLPNHVCTTEEGPRQTVAELLDEAQPLLLLAEGAAHPAATRPGLRTVRVAGPEPLAWSALLLRPDGYVAWAAPAGAGPDAGGLAEALDRWFGPAPARQRAERVA